MGFQRAPTPYTPKTISLYITTLYGFDGKSVRGWRFFVKTAPADKLPIQGITFI